MEIYKEDEINQNIVLLKAFLSYILNQQYQIATGGDNDGHYASISTDDEYQSTDHTLLLNYYSNDVFIFKYEYWDEDGLRQTNSYFLSSEDKLIIPEKLKSAMIKSLNEFIKDLPFS